MKLEDNLKIAKLVDTYGKLLTNKQFEIITSYLNDDLTLSEIADNVGISRQAVNDSINQSIKSLSEYEERLKIIEKEDELLGNLNELKLLLNEDTLIDKIDKIIEIIRS